MVPGPHGPPAGGRRRRRPPDPLLALGRVRRDLGGRDRAPARRSSRPRARCSCSAPRARARWTRRSRTSPRPASGCWWPPAGTSASAGRRSAPTTASTPCTWRASGAGRSTRRPWPRPSRASPASRSSSSPRARPPPGSSPTCPRCARRRATASWWPTPSRASGVADLPMDRWGVDVVVSGSQKGLMTPPGLAFVAASERAVARSAALGPGGFYLDWERTRKGGSRSPFTPPVTLVCQLQEALRLIEAEGLQNVFARHRVLGRMCRAGRGGVRPLPARPGEPRGQRRHRVPRARRAWTARPSRG